MSNLSIFGLPAQLHSLRLSAMIIVFWGVVKFIKNNHIAYFDKNNPTYRSWVSYVKVIIALFIYSILLMILIGKGDGFTFFDCMLNIVLFTLPVTWAFTKIFDNVSQFMHVLLFVGILQSLIIIYCLLDDSFALFLDLTFNVSETDYTAVHRGGYAGGLGCITAPGVIKYSTGLIACVYLYVRDNKVRYFIIFTVFAILSSMIARTGILIDIACLVAIVLSQNNVRKFAMFLIVLCAIIVVICTILSSGNLDSFLSERYARVMNLQETGVKEGFFNHYFNGEDTSFPPLNFDMILGTGVVSGKSANGYIINVDGGPLRVYSAVGIIFFILVYYFLLKQLIRIPNFLTTKAAKITMRLYMVILLISDFKEITFFVVYTMCIFYTCALLFSKDNKIYIQ